MSSLISLAIPVRNGENYLAACLESVMVANQGRYEIVVSNNFSTDGTQKILDYYREKTPELRVVSPPRDMNLAEHLNFVASQCNGDWIKFLCHDDLLFPQALDYISRALNSSATPQCALLGNAEVHLFSSNFQSVASLDASDTLKSQVWKGRCYLKQFFDGGAPVPSLTTACVKRSVFETFRGFDTKWQHLDTFLWCRLLLDYDFIRIENALTANRIHGGQVATQVRKVNRSTQEHREFWPGFLNEFRKREDLPWMTSLRLRLKWILVSATDAAIFYRKGCYVKSFKVIKDTGPFYFLITTTAFVRALYKEKKRVAHLQRHIPLHEIYPG